MLRLLRESVLRLAPSSIRALCRSLARHREDDFRPDFTNDFLQEGLRPLPDFPEAPPEPNAIVAHFVERSNPKFFVNIPDTANLVNHIAETDPDCKAQTLKFVYDVLQRTLPVHDHRYPGLSVGFSWDQLRRGNGDDVLHAWRANQLFFAPHIAIASYWDDSLTDALAEVLEHWARYARESGTSDAYPCNLVVLYRILALHWTFVFLAGSHVGKTKQALLYQIIKILHADARFLCERAGDSAPNNHLLADAFAMWYLGLQFPEFHNAEQWLSDGEALWLEELGRQTYADGTSFEHSVHYHELESEMAIAFLLLSRRSQREVPEWVSRRIQAMCRFQASCAGPSDTTLYLGDNIEEPIFSLDVPGAVGNSSIRRIHDVLYGPLFESARMPGPLRGRAYWLLGGTMAHTPAPAGQAFANGVGEVYPEGGYFFFSDRDSGTRVLFRTGPDTHQEVFGGHMHSDLLSLFLSVNAHPAIVEAGTYSYRSKARDAQAPNLPLRRYFFGPASHNGLVLPTSDPLGVAADDFRDFGQKTRVRAQGVGSEDSLLWIDGRVDGGGHYDNYRRGIVHIAERYLVVYDMLTNDQARLSPYLQFQFAEQCTIEAQTTGAVVARIGDAALRMYYPPAHLAAVVRKGSADPPAGWLSKSYGKLTPAPSLALGFLPDVGSTAIVLATKELGHRVEVLVEECAWGLSIRLDRDTTRDVILVNLTDLESEVVAHGIALTGSVAWVHDHGGAKEMRGLGVAHFLDDTLEIASKRGSRSASVRVQYDRRSFELKVGDAEQLSIRQRESR